jgi:serine protease Do
MSFSRVLNSSLLCLCLASSLVQAGSGKPQVAQTPATKTSIEASPSHEISNEAEICTSVTSAVSFDISKGFTHVAEIALPAVVNVATTQVIEVKDKGGAGSSGGDLPRFAPGSPFEEFFKEFFDQMERPRKVQSLGSGFIIRFDASKNIAYIVTNNHVIADAKKISIFLNDKTELEATVHAVDERTDIAVLKVSTETMSADKRKLPALEWGNSNVSRVGEWVLAIGNPFGLGSTVTAGIISTKGRELVTPTRNRVSDYVDDFIQHSAQINMGNSGGCLLSMEGKVIGINTAIFSPSGGNVGIGFAIPSDVAKATVDQLIEFGRTKRGWLGVRIQHLTEDMAESLGLKVNGAIVGSITPDGPAHKAGILSGDVILEFDGKVINETNRLSRLVGETPINKSCKIKVWRKGQEMTLNVTVGEFEDAVQKGKIDIGDKKTSIPLTQATEILGMQLTSIPDDIKTKLGQKDMKGVFIAKIDPSSSAADTGMARGDIIAEANQKEVQTPKDFVDNIEAAKKAKRKHILLLVTRNGEPRFVSLKVEEDKDTPALSQGSVKHPDSALTPSLTPDTIKPEEKSSAGATTDQNKDAAKQPNAPEHPANSPVVSPAA